MTSSDGSRRRCPPPCGKARYDSRRDASNGKRRMGERLRTYECEQTPGVLHLTKNVEGYTLGTPPAGQLRRGQRRRATRAELRENLQRFEALKKKAGGANS